MAKIRLDGADVTVFYTVVPPTAASVMARLTRYLEPEELDRANRFIAEKDRWLFITSRALLRLSLRSLAGDRHWRFRTGPHGKPEILAAAGETSVQFNLSHTAGLAVCAVSCRYAVGVDAESSDRRLEFSSIAERCFAPSERRSLEACPSQDRPAVFFRFWTLKEAVAKAIGGGLSIPLTDIVFTLDPLSLELASHLQQGLHRWHIEDRKPTPSHQVAVAVRKPDDIQVTVRWHSVDIESL